MKSICSALAIFVLLSGNCFAESKDKSLWENLKELKQGQKIQVIQWNSVTFEGKFQSFSEDAVTFEVKKMKLIIKRKDIRRVAKASGRGGHALIGLGIGSAVGLIGISANEGDGVYIAMALLPVFAGGGAIVGAAMPTKSVIYELAVPK
jgi:hypothetical protein